MINIAVILAGGTGSRMGMDIPKQFIRLQDGRTVLETCVAAFQQNEHIDEIAIVMHPAHKAEAKQLLPLERYTKIHYWIDGGSERWESSLHAVEAINRKSSLVPRGAIVRRKESSMDVNLLIHDCARPFVSQAIITNTCLALESHEAVTVAVPVTDTLYLTEPEKGIIQDVPPRSLYRRAQTPQGFRLSVLRQAFEALQHSPTRQITDDVGVVRTFVPGINIHLVEGEESNRKITYAEDLK